MATLKDVAKLANVNPSTVSRVLHGGNANVSEETRARILEAAGTLQYKVNAAARSLRTRVSGALGLVIPDIANPTYGQIIEGAELTARKHGFNIFLLNADSNPNLDVYLSMIQEGRIDGLIVANAHLHDTFVMQMEKRHLPYILVNRRTMGNAPYVVADDAEAARLQISHLLELGHTKVGYLSGPLHFDTAVTRLRGARQAFEEAQMDYRTDLPVVECDYSGEGVVEGVCTLLQLHPDITAIAGANFMITMAAVKALHSMGKRIPEDVSVIGQDDTPLAGLCVPGLTTVKTQLSLIGSRATELLIGKLKGVEIRSEILKNPPPTLVRRHSTAVPQTKRV
jgi:LacI family transcriptional regulator